MAAPPTGKLQCTVCQVDTIASTALICPSCQEANTNITKWFTPLPNWISSTQNNVVTGLHGTSQQQSKNPTTTNEGLRPPTKGAFLPPTGKVLQQAMSSQGYRSSFLGRTVEGSGALSSNEPPLERYLRSGPYHRQDPSQKGSPQQAGKGLWPPETGNSVPGASPTFTSQIIQWPNAAYSSPT